MSDPVAVAVIGGAVTLILGWMQRKTLLAVKRVEHNTNGMQKTIERLAELKGAQDEKDREK